MRWWIDCNHLPVALASYINSLFLVWQYSAILKWFEAWMGLRWEGGMVHDTSLFDWFSIAHLRDEIGWIWRPICWDVHVKLKATIDFGLEWQGHLVFNTLVLNTLYATLILFLCFFLLSDVVTNLHLLVNQIFGLSETSHKLLSLLFFQSSYLCLMHNICYL